MRRVIGMRVVTGVSLIVSCTFCPHASAQGNVTGILILQERPTGEPGDVRTAVIYLEGREPVVSDAEPAALRSETIAMRGREFVPHVRAVLTGGSVAFPNEDPFSHNVFSNAEPGPFDLGLYRRGATRTASFPRPGIYPIYCNIHSKMVSFVVAVPGPLVVQPDGDGRFLLQRVPAGRYHLHAWHERGGDEVVRELVVPASGVTNLQISVDARAYVATPHLNKFGRPYVVMRADRY